VPDPDSMRQAATDAANNTDPKIWSVVSLIFGGAIVKAVQRLRGDTIVDELRKQGDETRVTLNAVGEVTHRKLDALTNAVAHLQGQIDGSRR
jgi:hypothetical protein